MPIRVKAADGSIVTFPDGTSDDEIEMQMRARREITDRAEQLDRAPNLPSRIPMREGYYADEPGGKPSLHITLSPRQQLEEKARDFGLEETPDGIRGVIGGKSMLSGDSLKAGRAQNLLQGLMFDFGDEFLGGFGATA